MFIIKKLKINRILFFAAICTMLFVLFSIIHFYLNRISINQSSTISKTYYNVNLYGYFKSDIEDAEIANHYEMQVVYLTTVKE